MVTPGNVHCTIPQMLSAILDHKRDPYDAAVLPRLSPMTHDYTVEVENRIPLPVLQNLVKLGAKLKPLPPFDFRMGSFQQAWRDPVTGLLNAATDPRRAGEGRWHLGEGDAAHSLHRSARACMNANARGPRRDTPCSTS